MEKYTHIYIKKNFFQHQTVRFEQEETKEHIDEARSPQELADVAETAAIKTVTVCGEVCVRKRLQGSVTTEMRTVVAPEETDVVLTTTTNSVEEVRTIFSLNIPITNNFCTIHV